MCFLTCWGWIVHIFVAARFYDKQYIENKNMKEDARVMYCACEDMVKGNTGINIIISEIGIPCFVYKAADNPELVDVSNKATLHRNGFWPLGLNDFVMLPMTLHVVNDMTLRLAFSLQKWSLFYQDLLTSRIFDSRDSCRFLWIFGWKTAKSSAWSDVIRWRHDTIWFKRPVAKTIAASVFLAWISHKKKFLSGPETLLMLLWNAWNLSWGQTVSDVTVYSRMSDFRSIRLVLSVQWFLSSYWLKSPEVS